MKEELQKKFKFEIDDFDIKDEDRLTIKRIRHGEKEASNVLIKKYENLVNRIASQYFVAGGDRNDLAQEGMMGLFSAIEKFDLGMEIPFKNFAGTCIKRRIVTAIKNSTRQKHIPLNSSISLTQDAYNDLEDGGKQVIDTIDIETPDVAEAIANKEAFSQIYSKMSKVLSPLERDVFHYKLNGYSYEQMAQMIGTSEKAIDNAVQRIKGKVTKHIIGSDEIEM